MTLRAALARAGRSVRNNITVGLVLVTPIVLTGIIVNGLFRFATNRLVPASLRGSEREALFRVGALLAVLVALFFVGLLVRNFAGRRLYRLGDQLLARVPVINKIYVSVREISQALIAQRQTLFREAVLVEYPRKGVYSVAFVTATVPERVVQAIKGEAAAATPWVSLFVPTTPNPTSGMLILAPRPELVPLPMSVADAMKLIIAAGAVFPGEEREEAGPTLLDALEAWLARDTRAGDKPLPEKRAEAKR